MNQSRACLSNFVFASLSVLIGIFTAGCEKDEIQRYQVPKAEKIQPVDVTGSKSEQRLLAAIFPQPDRTWFFKLTGPAQDIAILKDTFQAFIQSVRFTAKGDQPVTWKTPEGWKQEAGNSMRFATLRPEATPGVELTVVGLGKEAGSLLANVNRWRGQLGLNDITEAELGHTVKKSNIGGTEVTQIDLIGRGAPPAKKTPPFARGMGKRPPRSEPPTRTAIAYQKPDSWQEAQDPSGVSYASFQLGGNEGPVVVTVTPLGGVAGGLLGNVNRWRSQIGLEPLTEEKLAKEMQQIEAAGAKVPYVDLVGLAGVDSRQQRILAAVVAHDGTTWFFKMRGPADLVGKYKGEFEAFLKTVHFDGGNHG